MTPEEWMAARKRCRAGSDLCKALDEITRLEKQLGEWASKFLKYGEHLWDCDRIDFGDLKERSEPCNCGFAKLQAKAVELEKRHAR